MQDGHQVHHHVVARHGARQRRFVMHIKFQRGQPGQGYQVAGIVEAPGQRSHRVALAHQFFTHVRTNEARATQNQYFFHDFTLVKGPVRTVAKCQAS